MTTDPSGTPAERPRSAEAPWAAKGWPAERPGIGPGATEIWCYAPRFSYRHGERVDVHLHTAAAEFSLKVVRDGLHPEVVLRRDGLKGEAAVTPEDSYARGCDWPVQFSFEVEQDWRPGFYLLVVTAIDELGLPVEREHFIVVRAATPGSHSRTALMLTTSTLIAYNDWGGANSYRGIGDDPREPIPSAELSIRRPISRGHLRLPPNAPREAFPGWPPPNSPPRYPSIEFARLTGYARSYGSAFWATYERPFVTWAEANGYEFEYLTQHDIHFEDALAPYDALVIVGHDEYWTAEMRDAVDDFVDRGGRLTRFGGNFIWQVRLDEVGAQTCYKDPRFDPYWSDPEKKALTTTAWDFVGRPAAQTMGLSGVAGCYNRYGSAVPRSSGGFTVCRPDHWAFAGTGLEYGDLLGGDPICVAAFEMDGLNYTYRDGLPYPTDLHSPPEGLEILAIAPATSGEVDRWASEQPLNAPEDQVRDLFLAAYGDEEGERLFERHRYGSGMIAYFERGSGSVFNAGSTEWVNGLIHRDPFIEIITRNALERTAQA